MGEALSIVRGAERSMGAIDTTVTRDGLRNAAQRSMTPWLDRRSRYRAPKPTTDAVAGETIAGHTFEDHGP